MVFLLGLAKIPSRHRKEHGDGTHELRCISCGKRKKRKGKPEFGSTSRNESFAWGPFDDGWATTRSQAKRECPIPRHKKFFCMQRKEFPPAWRPPVQVRICDEATVVCQMYYKKEKTVGSNDPKTE
jgi:hypothetical protein